MTASAAVALAVVLVLMGSVGLDLAPPQLRDVLSDRRLLLRGALATAVLIPGANYLGATALWHLEPSALLAVMLCASAGGGPVGPVLAQQARADVPAAATLMLLSNLVNFLSIPIWLAIADASAATLPWAKMMVTVASLLAPLALGAVLRARAPVRAVRLLRFTKPLSSVLMVVASVVIIGQHHPQLLAVTGHELLAALALSGLGSLIGALTAGQQRRFSGALSLGVRNMGLILLLAALWSGGRTMIVCLVYGTAMYGWAAAWAGIRVAQSRLGQGTA